MSSFTNEAGWDRALRIAVGVALLYLGWGDVIGGTVGAIFKVVGFIPLVTGIVGWCALYDIIGISTCRSRTPGMRDAA